jgi:hypothetical protein
MTSIDTSAAQIATPIQFIKGAMSAQAPGQFSTPDQQIPFTVQAQAGQLMIVNVIGLTPMLATQGVVVFPNGQQTGGPGGVVMNQVLQESGTYSIRAGQHTMATNLPQGELLVEVIVLPPYLLNPQ